MEKDLFKKILGEMISLDYEDMSPEEVMRTAIGALNSFAKQNSITWHSDLPCQECGGTGEVSTMERVYNNEPHMADVGTAPCPACRPPRDEDDTDDQDN